MQLDDFGERLGGLTSFQIHPSGREAIFAAGSRDFDFDELHRVPLDLSGPARILNGLVEPDEKLIDFKIEPETDRILYRVFPADASQFLTHLYGAPLDLSAPRVRLDPFETNVLDYRPAAGRVLYRKSTDPSRDRFELFSVPPDGSSAPQVLNGPLSANDGRVYAYEVTPDESRVVYLASQNFPNRAELFSVPTDGSGGPTQLSPTPVPNGEVWRGQFRITPDGARVVFAGDLTLNSAVNLWVAPVAGGAPAQALWTTVAGREVERLEVTSDSTRAVFTADGLVAGKHQLYAVPVDGSASAAPLPTTPGAPKVYEFLLSPDGTRAVYGAGALVSVRVDGSADPIVLSQMLPSDRHIPWAPQVTNDWVLYRADADVRDRYDLFVVPIDGSLTPRRVNQPTSDRGVSSFAFAGDEVLFLAPTSSEYESWQIFRAPLGGGAPPRSLNLPGTFATNTFSPRDFLVHPDERRVLFRAQPSTPGGFYPGIGLYLGFLGQPIRGAERP